MCDNKSSKILMKQIKSPKTVLNIIALIFLLVSVICLSFHYGLIVFLYILIIQGGIIFVIVYSLITLIRKRDKFLEGAKKNLPCVKQYFIRKNLNFKELKIFIGILIPICIFVLISKPLAGLMYFVYGIILIVIIQSLEIEKPIWLKIVIRMVIFILVMWIALRYLFIFIMIWQYVKEINYV